MSEILSTFPLSQLILLGVVFIAFLIQLVCWLRYRTLAGHRHPYRLKEGEPLPPVSVVVIVKEDQWYLESGLPSLMEQDHPQYEVVVVNDCGGPEIDDDLEILTKRYANLRYTTIRKDDRFSHSRKIPLVVGIKACRYQNIMVTDVDARPESDKWLANMSKGFVGPIGLVIGYTGFEPRKGVQDKYIRCSRLAWSVRYLRAAVSGRAYRGIYNNIGYTKNLFFDHRGFTHLNMAIGEDDLFVQRVAGRNNTAVVINPSSTVRQQAGGGLGWWWREQRYRTYGFKLYPRGVKASVATELISRAVFFIAAAALGCLSGLDANLLWTGAAGLFLFREVIVLTSVRKICRRLGERSLVPMYFLYDLISPLTETILGISRRVKPPAGIWN